ncbi:hypothetical protein OIO90_000267 [Microbotryomycetes sp. JL221]|nr:hypothetical protein OIO90_000267 [Microbotryomycetes sp. JL221]
MFIRPDALIGYDINASSILKLVSANGAGGMSDDVLVANTPSQRSVAPDNYVVRMTQRSELEQDIAYEHETSESTAPGESYLAYAQGQATPADESAHRYEDKLDDQRMIFTRAANEDASMLEESMRDESHVQDASQTRTRAHAQFTSNRDLATSPTKAWIVPNTIADRSDDQLGSENEDRAKDMALAAADQDSSHQLVPSRPPNHPSSHIASEQAAHDAVSNSSNKRSSCFEAASAGVMSGQSSQKENSPLEGPAAPDRRNPDGDLSIVQPPSASLASHFNATDGPSSSPAVAQHLLADRTSDSPAVSALKEPTNGEVLHESLEIVYGRPDLELAEPHLRSDPGCGQPWRSSRPRRIGPQTSTPGHSVKTLPPPQPRQTSPPQPLMTVDAVLPPSPASDGNEDLRGSLTPQNRKTEGSSRSHGTMSPVESARKRRDGDATVELPRTSPVIVATPIEGCLRRSEPADGVQTRAPQDGSQSRNALLDHSQPSAPSSTGVDMDISSCLGDPSASRNEQSDHLNSHSGTSEHLSALAFGPNLAATQSHSSSDDDQWHRGANLTEIGGMQSSQAFATQFEIEPTQLVATQLLYDVEQRPSLDCAQNLSRDLPAFQQDPGREHSVGFGAKTDGDRHSSPSQKSSVPVTRARKSSSSSVVAQQPEASSSSAPAEATTTSEGHPTSFGGVVPDSQISSARPMPSSSAQQTGDSTAPEHSADNEGQPSTNVGDIEIKHREPDSNGVRARSSFTKSAQAPTSAVSTTRKINTRRIAESESRDELDLIGTAAIEDRADLSAQDASVDDDADASRERENETWTSYEARPIPRASKRQTTQAKTPRGNGDTSGTKSGGKKRKIEVEVPALLTSAERKTAKRRERSTTKASATASTSRGRVGRSRSSSRAASVVQSSDLSVIDSGDEDGSKANDMDVTAQSEQSDAEHHQAQAGPSRLAPKRKRRASRPASRRVSTVSDDNNAAKGAKSLSTAPFIRVMGLWRDDGWMYPATILSTSTGHARVKFEDGAIGKLQFAELRRCELRPDDVIHIYDDATGGPSTTQPDYAVICCVEEANHDLKAGALESQDEIIARPIKSATTTAMGDDRSNIARLKVAGICIRPEHVSRLDDRRLTPREIAQFEGRSNQGPVNALPLLDVPAAPEVEHPTINKRAGLFARTAFVMTKVDHDRQQIETSIQDKGGTVLDIDQFMQVVTGRKGQNVSVHFVTAPYRDIDTILLLADRPSTTPKYLISLALGIPCVCAKFVLQSVSEGVRLDWRDFALSSGTLQSLGTSVVGAQIRSMTKTSFDLASIVSFRQNFGIFRGRAVLLVWTKPTKASVEMRSVLTILAAAGALKVDFVSKSGTAGDASNYDHVILEDGQKRPASMSTHSGVGSLTWLKQCLIAGRVLPAALLKPVAVE